jgi:hypothetical protein
LNAGALMRVEELTAELGVAGLGHGADKADLGG